VGAIEGVGVTGSEKREKFHIATAPPSPQDAGSNAGEAEAVAPEEFPRCGRREAFRAILTVMVGGAEAATSVGYLSNAPP
jgi:hypothetical protein